MKKKYIIRYLPLFYRDLENIIDYIKYDLQNDTAANRFVDEVENVIKERLQSPESFEKYISNKKRADTYYRIYVKNFTIFYVVKDDIMEVRRILYSRSNFDKLI